MNLTFNKKSTTRKDVINVAAIGITVGGIVSGASVAIMHNSITWGIDPLATLVLVLCFIPSSGYILFRVCFKAFEIKD